jgi:hypothetical protein
MSEPHSVAKALDIVLPGLFHWCVHDDRIDSRSEAYALTGADGTVLIDPLPLADEPLSRLRDIAAIVLTIGSHQRAAWRFRRRFGVPVWAPVGAEGLEEAADRLYAASERLPGALHPIHTPGPSLASYALSGRTEAGSSFLLIGDLLMRGEEGPLRFVPGEFMVDPARARTSAAALLEVPSDVLCPGHGAPVILGVRAALKEALERDGAP